MIMKAYQEIFFALLISAGIAANAQAETLLDTGAPTDFNLPISLDGTDYAASKFHIGGNYTINDIAGYFTGGSSGDTFTIALYQDNNGHVGTQLQSVQATFSADGWNGVSALHWTAGPGDYWVAFEVGADDYLDNFNLLLPLNAPNHTLATAFNDGSGYHNFAGFDYGVKVSGVAAVPVPGAAWLFFSGLGCIAGLSNRRKN
jgi:hypothetical protein